MRGITVAGHRFASRIWAAPTAVPGFGVGPLLQRSGGPSFLHTLVNARKCPYFGIDVARSTPDLKIVLGVHSETSMAKCRKAGH